MKTKITLKTVSVMLALGLPLASFGQGGDRVGGGGDLLLCTDNGVTKYWLLDMYEGFTRANEQISIGKPGQNIFEKILAVKAVYEPLDPVRAQKYAMEAVKIAEDLDALKRGLKNPNGIAMFTRPGEALADVDDEGEIYKFPNCEKEGKLQKFQLVVQDHGDDEVPEYYLFDRANWAKIENDIDQQVATIYHEVIYRDHREHKQMISRTTRRLNRWLATGQISTLTSQKYLEFLVEKNLGAWVVDQYFAINTLKGTIFDENGELVQAAGGFEYLKDEKQKNNPDHLWFRVAQPQFDHRRFVSGTNTHNLFLVEYADADYLRNQNREVMGKPRPGFLSGGTLSVLADGTLSLKEMRKSYDGGIVNVVIFKAGKILTREESGYWSGQLDIGTYQKGAELLSCVRNGLESRRAIDTVYARSLQWLISARKLLYAKDLVGLSQFVKECEGLLLSIRHESKMRKSKYSEKLNELVAKTDKDNFGAVHASQVIQKMSDHDVVICDQGFDVSAEAYLFGGLAAGIRGLACTMTNGKRFSYLGVMAGAGLGIGGMVHAGGLTLKPINEEAGKVGLLTAQMTVKGVAGPFSYQAPVDFDPHPSLSKAVFMGLEIEIMGVKFNGMFRVKRRADDFSLLIHEWTRQFVGNVEPR